ncbi:MAG: hypothetical protein ABEK10_02905 [Candidatus Nanosalina sp.]
MEWIEDFLSDPGQLAALGYGAAALTVSAYAAYRNDFGATDRTTRELEDYLENVDTGPASPVSAWKAFEYRKELEERNTEPEIVGKERIYSDVREAHLYSDD